ncbi:hypothetical protein [Brevundimonas viscosa]|uniref:Uncharacterized protein n=1 Tax=Brevundimonas viscosa TaxID=871741 RepID=A0A1I6T2W5_9CAUL|nr:hypothetical protein [Brevundimonas viscosa]SFS83378.1 hypothetical protein SAMN05192570_2901 [Brevundimonas viscosa]
MTTTLIVVVLLVLGVGIVLWAVRRKPADRPDPLPGETDTAWNDPVTRADAAPPSRPDAEPRP